MVMFPSRFPSVLILPVLLTSMHVQGRAFHFDSRDGTEPANGLTPATARRTLATIRNVVLNPGDSLLMRRGSVWTGDSLLLQGYGSASVPWVVGAYGDPADPPPSLSNSGRVVTVKKAGHLVVQDLELSGAHGGCIELADSTVSQAVFQRLDLHHCGGGIYVTGTDIAVLDSRIHDGKMVVNTPAKDDDYGATGVGLSQVSGCRVQGNLFWNLIAPSIDYGFDGGAVETWKTVRHCDVSRNLAIGCDGFVEFGGQKGDSVVDFALHHNVSFGSKLLACLHLADTNSLFGIGYDSVRFDHNLVVDRFQTRWGFHVAADGGAPERLDRIKFRQNIWVTDSANLIWYQGGRSKDPTWVHQSNLVWNREHDPFKGDRIAGPGEVYADPQFSGPWRNGTVDDTVLSHYGLASGSPARGTGVDLGYAVDFFGKPYVRGAATDWGPFAPGAFGARLVGERKTDGLRARLEGRTVVVTGNPSAAPVAWRLALVDPAGRKVSSTSSVCSVGGAAEIRMEGMASGGLVVVHAQADLPDGSRESLVATLAVP